MAGGRRYGNVCICVADSLCYKAETNTPLWSNYTSIKMFKKKNKKKTQWDRDFPGGPVVETPPSNAGDTGSSPGWRTKIPHAMGQLSLRAATTEHAGHN